MTIEYYIVSYDGVSHENARYNGNFSVIYGISSTSVALEMKKTLLSRFLANTCEKTDMSFLRSPVQTVKQKLNTHTHSRNTSFGFKRRFGATLRKRECARSCLSKTFFCNGDTRLY